MLNRSELTGTPGFQPKTQTNNYKIIIYCFFLNPNLSSTLSRPSWSARQLPRLALSWRLPTKGRWLRHLFQRLSVLFARGNAALLLNRFPTFANTDIDGVQWSSTAKDKIDDYKYSLIILVSQYCDKKFALNCTPFSELMFSNQSRAKL